MPSCNQTLVPLSNPSDQNRWETPISNCGQMTANTSVPSGAKLKLDFSYDHRSRRTSKAVSTWNGSAYVGQSTNKFGYDDWNLFAEVNHTNKAVRSYLWGSDLSGSPQGAGGVGGLL